MRRLKPAATARAASQPRSGLGNPSYIIIKKRAGSLPPHSIPKEYIPLTAGSNPGLLAGVRPHGDTEVSEGPDPAVAFCDPMPFKHT